MCASASVLSPALNTLLAELGSNETQHYSSIKEAKGSKLVFNLLQLPGVTEVFLGRDFVSINKEEQVEWMVCHTLKNTCLTPTRNTHPGTHVHTHRS